MYTGSCAVSQLNKLTGTEVLISNNNKHRYHHDNSAPYRHIDDVTKSTLHLLTSQLSVNGDVRFQCVNIMSLVAAVSVTVTWLV